MDGNVAHGQAKYELDHTAARPLSTDHRRPFVGACRLSLLDVHRRANYNRGADTRAMVDEQQEEDSAVATRVVGRECGFMCSGHRLRI